MTDDERCQKYFNKRFPLTGPVRLGPCEACGGSGKLIPLAPWKECTRCHGTGRVLIARREERTP